MKTLLLIALAALAVSAQAESTTVPVKSKLSKEERARRIMEKVGGFLYTEAKGTIVIVNAQTGFDLNQISNSINTASNNFKTAIPIKAGPFSVAGARETMKRLGATVAVFIVDDPALPMSLTSHEELWSVVNIARLKADVSDDVLAKRVAKEFNRTLMFNFGVCSSALKTSIMKPIFEPAGLDKCVDMWIPFDAVGSALNAMPGYGIVPVVKTTYRRACEEGWAPAPTNDYQKVIWEQIHAKPTNPMRIKFDPKKGE